MPVVSRAETKDAQLIYYLHIGLPKTATTFWQQSVMPSLDRIKFVRARSDDQRHRNISRLIQHYAQMGNMDKRRLGLLTRRLKALENEARAEGVEEILISQENISVTAQGLWTGDNAGPMVVVNRLKRLQESLGNPEFRIIIGIRRPETWIASRYAESAKGSNDAGQADFEQKVRQICNADTAGNGANWLRYTRVQKLFAEAFGESNVFLIPIEELEQDPEASILLLGKFVGDRDLKSLVESMKQNGEIDRRWNALQQTGWKWKLKRKDGEITLSDGQLSLIRKTFGDGKRLTTRQSPVAKPSLFFRVWRKLGVTG